MDRLEQCQLKIDVVCELPARKRSERVQILFRRVTGGVAQIGCECLLLLGIFLHVTQQECARFGAVHGDGDIGNRPGVLLAQIFLNQPRQQTVELELVAQGLADDIKQVGVC